MARPIIDFTEIGVVAACDDGSDKEELDARLLIDKLSLESLSDGERSRKCLKSSYGGAPVVVVSFPRKPNVCVSGTGSRCRLSGLQIPSIGVVIDGVYCA
jgi:hypothetical protein